MKVFGKLPRFNHAGTTTVMMSEEGRMIANVKEKEARVCNLLWGVLCTSQLRLLKPGVTPLGSVINWQRPLISRILVTKREFCTFTSGNKLQLTESCKYYSLFSASILSITFSSSLNSSGGELGGRPQVQIRNAVFYGLF